MSIIRVFRRGEVFAICKEALAQAPDDLDTRELGYERASRSPSSAQRAWTIGKSFADFVSEHESHLGLAFGEFAT